MKINDSVILTTITEHYSRGVVGNKYKIVEILKTELKLCSLSIYGGDHCFYTHPDNVKNCSVTDSTAVNQKNETYWEQEISGTTKENEAFAANLDAMIKDITNLLKSKNKAYGNSALKPAKIFSQLDATDSLCARIDDKLMRIKNRGITDATEDTVDDLIGYLLLLKMSM